MSRDPKRIDEILGVIRKAWKANPDLRLMQLIINSDGEFEDIMYFLEDDRLLDSLKFTYSIEDKKSNK